MLLKFDTAVHCGPQIKAQDDWREVGRPQVASQLPPSLLLFLHVAYEYMKNVLFFQFPECFKTQLLTDCFDSQTRFFKGS